MLLSRLQLQRLRHTCENLEFPLGAINWKRYDTDITTDEALILDCREVLTSQEAMKLLKSEILQICYAVADEEDEGQIKGNKQQLIERCRLRLKEALNAARQQRAEERTKREQEISERPEKNKKYNEDSNSKFLNKVVRNSLIATGNANTLMRLKQTSRQFRTQMANNATVASVFDRQKQRKAVLPDIVYRFIYQHRPYSDNMMYTCWHELCYVHVQNKLTLEEIKFIATYTSNTGLSMLLIASMSSHHSDYHPFGDPYPRDQIAMIKFLAEHAKGPLKKQMFQQAIYNVVVRHYFKWPGSISGMTYRHSAAIPFLKVLFDTGVDPNALYICNSQLAHNDRMPIMAILVTDVFRKGFYTANCAFATEFCNMMVGYGTTLDMSFTVSGEKHTVQSWFKTILKLKEERPDTFALRDRQEQDDSECTIAALESFFRSHSRKRNTNTSK